MTEFRMEVGLPSSGKSRYAENMRQNGYTVFSSDEMREKDGIRDNDVIFRTLHAGIIGALKKGKSCILDATNLGRKKRFSLLEQAKRAGAATVCDLFVVPVPVLKERNRSRENTHGVTDEVIEQMLRRFECPWYSDGFDRIEVHAYDGGYTPEYTKEDLMSFVQDNPHHLLTVGEHEEEAYRYIRINHALTEHYPFLLEAARYHDDGKFFTKTFFNMKGERTETAHYYGHDNVGSYLFLLRAFCTDQYERPDEYPLTEWGKLYVATLIGMHMRPLVAWKNSEKARERDRKRIGEELYADILTLNEADLHAKGRVDQ